MCMFSGPKPVASPPPPPPPPEEPPVAPVFDNAKLSGESEDEYRRLRRVGRTALRVDLQTHGASGDGLQAPKN